jgi:hypothetical protein
MASIIVDLEKNRVTKKYAIILRLVGLAIAGRQLVKDYKQCKSLLDDILVILKLI